MTLHQRLSELLSACSPSEADVALALKRAERVGKILRNEPGFGTDHWEVGGSCAKGTAIFPVKDVDLFVYLDETCWRTTKGGRYQPGTLISLFKQRLCQTYALHIDKGDVRVKAQDHSVRVEYLKEGSQHIDVVPALWKKNPQCVAEIPEKSSAGWVRTSIWRQQRILDDLDSHTKALRGGVRLLKVWRRHHRITCLKSYGLELLAMAAWQRGCAQSPGGVFLDVLRHMVETSLRDPIIIDHHLKNFELPKRKAVVIMDAAVKANNVARTMNTEDRRDVVRCARFTLECLEEVSGAGAAGRDRAAKAAFRSALGKAPRAY